MSSLPGLKSQIARGKIKFFVIERIIRDVHLSILTQKFPIGILSPKEVLDCYQI